MKFAVRNEKKRKNAKYMGNPYIKMIEEKINDEMNNYCVECGNENPEYISINNGVFICADCAQNHFKFPKNISHIIKNNIKNLRFNEIQPLLCGGNNALLNFINKEFPKLSEFPPHILYRTQAMIYYRQNLQYLIKGGIEPVKPSIKNAYKVSNFNNNYNSNHEMEDDYYNNIDEERNILNNINYNKYYQTRINFGKGRNNNKNMNDFDIRLANTISNGENNYNNYIINKPRQVNFQNNNNIIIGNLDNNKGNRLIYSPQKIKIDFKPKNPKLDKNNNNSSIPYYFNNVNEVYVKPRLVLSPKAKNNFTPTEGLISHRKSSGDIIKRNTNIQNKSELFEKGEIVTFQIINTINGNDNNTINNWYYPKMSRNLSQSSYAICKNPTNYIRKNKFIHKSLSQRIIKNNPDFINNDFNSGQTESNIFSPSRNPLSGSISSINICLSDNNEIQPIPRKKTMNTILNRNKNNKRIESFFQKNDKSSTQETINFSEVESLPIKINLKINKKEKNSSKCDKKVIAKENNFYSANESRINKNNKNKDSIPIKFNTRNKIKVNQKEKKIEEIKVDKFDNKIKITKVSFGLNKNRSQENIFKNNYKNDFENKIQKKSNISIRNKYKLKNTNTNK